MVQNFTRSLLRSWILLTIACILLAFAGVYWALGSIDAIFSYRSLLKDNPPPAAGSVGGPMARQVVFVLVDALRYDTSLNPDVMPNLNNLRQQGAFARMHSRPPSYSQPGYTTLLTGAWPNINDGPVVNEEYADIWTFSQDNLFSQAQHAGLKTAVSGYNWFERLIPQEAVTASFYTVGEDAAADRDVLDAALPWLKSGEYSLVLIHIDQVDYAGHHEGGPDGPNWNLAAGRADQLLGEILAAMDLSRDIIFVASDHGQIDRGGHGGQDAITLVEPFVFAGKSVRPGDYGEVEMVDVAPTLAALLGTGQPAVSQGRPQTQMFNLTPEWALLMKTTSDVQHANLLAAFRTASNTPAAVSIEAAQAELQDRGKAVRLIIALLLLILPAAWFIWLRNPDWKWLLGGAALAQAAFHFNYSVLEKRTYSLSSVDGQTQLLTTAAVGAVAGLLLVAILVSVYSARQKSGLSAKQSLIFILSAINLQALPVLWSFYLNGWNIPGVLPDMGSAFMGVLSAAQIAVTGLVGLMLVGIVALVVRFKR
jgi:hypothetical protein